MFVSSLVLTTLYALSWVFYSKFQFLERDYSVVNKNPNFSKSWHFWKAINQVIFFIVMLISFGFELTLINALCFWIIFDGLLNKIVLKKNFFYIGDGRVEFIDTKFHNFADWLNQISKDKFKKYITAHSVSAFVKISFLALLLFLYF